MSMTHIQEQDTTSTSIGKAKLQVFALAIAAFVFCTTEFIPIALLSDIGASFGKSASATGVMMTVYAWVVAVISLPAVLVCARMERRRLLLTLFFIFTLGHGISAMAGSFAMLLISRVLVALSHAVFWSITASLVVRLAPQGWQTKALGLLATGSMLALVAGLPLGRMLGQMISWRATFLLIGVLGMTVMALIAWLLPRLPAQNAGNLSSLKTILQNKPLLTAYALITLVVMAHFSAYSYVEPFVINLGGFAPSFATIALLGFGIAGIIASWLFGRWFDHYPRIFLYSAIVLLGASLVLAYPLLGVLKQGFLALVLIWGVAITAAALALQIQILRLARAYSDVAMSLFSALYNIGIGGGALIGSITIAHIGLPNIGYIGAILALLALLVYSGFHFLHQGDTPLI